MTTGNGVMQTRVFGKLFWFVPCDGRGCEHKFGAGQLRYGRETVGRGYGFYCETCFEEHCPGRSWEKAETLLGLAFQMFSKGAVEGIASMIMGQAGNGDE